MQMCGCMMTGSKALASRLLIEGPNTYTISYVKLMWLSQREISRSYTQCVSPCVGSMFVKNSKSLNSQTAPERKWAQPIEVQIPSIRAFLWHVELLQIQHICGPVREVWIDRKIGSSRSFPRPYLNRSTCSREGEEILSR